MTDKPQANEQNNGEQERAGASVRVTGGGPAPERPRRRVAVWLAWLFLLLALAAGGAAAWLWHQLQLAERARAYNTERLGELEDRIAALDTRFASRAALAELAESRAAAQARLENRLLALEEGVAVLRNAVQGGRAAWLRAEVKYLLRLAHEELHLAHNVAGALTALRAADERLQSLADPALHPVRAKLREHIAALEALPDPDVTGMALTLNALAGRVRELPLARRAHREYAPENSAGPPAASGFWTRLWRGLSGAFANMVTVRRNETPVRPLLPPEQEYFVYQNLALQLQMARLALLRGDGANFRASLDTARAWLTTWFDTADPAVKSALADIEGLLEQPMPAELPDISGALQLLKARLPDEDAG